MMKTNSQQYTFNIIGRKRYSSVMWLLAAVLLIVLPTSSEGHTEVNSNEHKNDNDTIDDTNNSNNNDNENRNLRGGLLAGMLDKNPLVS